jgi:prevent-host-death family protein
MKTYTYSEARQRLAQVLDEARDTGEVQIRRRDGQVFVLQPVDLAQSPLDVPAVSAGLEEGESLTWLQTEREASGDRALERARGGAEDTPPPLR